MNTAMKHTNKQALLIDQPKNKLTRMTEVIIPQGSNSHHIIFPLVASMTKQQILQKQQTWVTWITDRQPSYEQLKHFGVNAEALRVIHIDKHKDNRWIIWEALNTGNSHSVIADICDINANDVKQMEVAAANGQCTGVLIRSLA